MKKTTRRILCGALSLAMCSTLVLESVLRVDDAESVSAGVTATASTTFQNVTGQYDTAALQEKYFNDTVKKAEDVAPRYEVRTVMVTLSGAPLADRAEEEAVSEYIGSFSGKLAKAELKREQAAFLQALSQRGIPYELDRSYTNVLNGVAVELDTKYVSSIKKMDGVESVVITTAFAEPKTAKTEGSGVVINETEVYETGIYNSSAFTQKYGAGAVVAVLDTGLDYTHDAFQQFQSAKVDFAWDWTTVKTKITELDLVAEERSGSLDVADVYMNDKVPFAYDYADDDPDVYPSYSNHGTHVAGIIGGYDPDGYTDKDGNPITDKKFLGVVPDAQLMICKVFTDDLDDPDLGGAVSEDIVAALDDCVTMGVDVINMSLGSSCGFTTTNDGDDEGDMLNEVYKLVRNSGISLICAASNDYSSGYGGVYGTNLATNPDAGTVGSPSTYPGALSVASINGQQADYFVANDGTDAEAYVFFEESRDINSNPYDFVKTLQEQNGGKTTYEYVVVPGVGHPADYTSAVKRALKDDNGNSRDRIALIKRGDTTFEEKVEVAMEMGAAGVIVYNNVAGVIRMNLGEIDNPVPSVSIGMNAGNAMVKGATLENGRVGQFTVDEKNAAGPFMSEFSSWGPTPDLKLKPEITAHGGEITSAVPGGYGEQSGTSMATPNMAGFMAIVRSYLKQQGYTDAKLINQLANQLTMSTAGTVYDQDGLPYSPRKQGAGVAKLENVINSKAYLWTENAENDNRPKVELGDDPARNGDYTITFKVTNKFGSSALNFTLDYEFMTETLSSDKLTVAEQAHLLTDSTAVWEVNDKEVAAGETVSVAANETKTITLKLTLGKEGREYIEESFENGMYVEGFAKLKSTTKGQCDLTLPFLGFYGDWDAAPMLDYSAYEVAANEQDASVLEEDKIKASVWATQPYNIYYNDKYVLPMGGYLYLLPEDAEPMYVDEAHNAVSRYNEYYGEGETENYMTTTGIKAVYAGLLRNARVVKYNLYDEATGELLRSDIIPRVSKAYSGGGQATPANVKLELYPEEEGWVANGTYKMTFEFFKDKPAEGEVASAENTFEFSFTVDYEAPIMEDARVRFYNYKDGNKEKQRIYLDVDVYDNHYAQTLMLCYPTTASDGDVSLQLLTDYPTPIRKAVKNGITTVSIEITDVYEKYGDQLYVQIDDYAMNTCLYQVNINEANADILPEGADFSLAAGEENVTLNIYETHKSALVYGSNYTGTADLSNFLWTSANPNVADVKNGEIVGLKAGTTKIFVSNRKGGVKTINVTVNDGVSNALAKVPAISFGAIKTDRDALQKADGLVQVNAGQQIKMTIETDPWYHPMTDLKLKWSSSNEAIATVDQDGNVTTVKKGTAVISAIIMQKNAAGEWTETLYSATSVMQVQNEFKVSNYTLSDYNGLGYNAEDGYTLADGVLKIPTDMNIMYIGEEAFKDNNNIKKIIIPSSVVDIRPRAFLNCTALEEVYFVSEEKQAIADADLSMIYENAFSGCINLKKIDFSNVKTVTVAQDCFSGCTKLTEVVDMPSIGTMHHRAFAGTALKSVDLTGLHLSGNSVFAGCTELTTIKTGRFTAIGDYMFSGCTNLRNEVTIHTPKIGRGAFSGCINLAGVKFRTAENAPATSITNFDIGARAFENCGSNVKGNFTVDFGTENIRSIGERAFAGSSLKTLGQIYGLEVLGENAFINTGVTSIVLTDDMDLEIIRLTGIPFDGLTVSVGEGATKYSEENGVIYNKDKSVLYYVNSSVEGEFILPDGVERIGDYAFANSKVSKVTLANTVTGMGVGAFKGAKLTAIDFGGSAITAIPASAFEGSNLLEITLPDTVKTVGNSAFAKSAIAAFTGEGLEALGDNVFEGCNALISIVLADGIVNMGSYTFYNCVELKEVTMPSLGTLGDYTFFGANKLEKVTFGNKAKTTGNYTFARTPVTTVTLGGEVASLGYGLFYDCRQLESVTLPVGARTIDGLAFYGCRKLTEVVGIDRVRVFGEGAFYGTALTELTLTAAEEIGRMAFATENGSKANYSVISIPAVKAIDAQAFYNSQITTIALPASLEKLGYAAFASSNKLATVTVDEENPYFFVEDNVLYRYTKDNEFELVFYPTARVAAGEEGSRSYEVKEGTTRILAYAFFELNDGVVDSVLLPYSVNAIGDNAFFASGIKEYTFESIVAPVLETSYREDIRGVINASATVAEYKGYYNTNFETYLYYFTKYGGQKSELIMNYPANGSGYDNPIYTMYFGVKNASKSDLMEDSTRETIASIEGMYTAEEVAAWLTLPKTEENVKMVKAFVETMKVTRIGYNNAMSKEGQAVFLSDEHTEKLLAVEEKLRAVKQYFEIPFIIQDLQVAENSTHKTEYLMGEKFDMTGLSVLIVYDDYSMVEADFSKLVLLTNGELIPENKYVNVQYEGKIVRVAINVTDPSAVVTPPTDSTTESSDNDASQEEGGSNLWIILVCCGGGLAILAVGAFFFQKKRKSGNKENTVAPTEAKADEESLFAENEVTEEASEETEQNDEEK